MNELSWERVKPGSLADGTEIYIVLKTLVIADDCQELIKRIGHETVNENLNNDVMKNMKSHVNLGVSSEEPEFAWTLLCHTTKQKSVKKTDTNWTDRDSEDQCGDVVCKTRRSFIEHDTQVLGQRSDRTMDDQVGNDDRGGLGWMENSAGGLEHWIDHWGGLI